MKNLLFLLLGIFFIPQLCEAQKNWESIVQIEVQGKTRGIGVVAVQPDHVVTALHVVAGQVNIRVYSKARGRSVPATIIRVHKLSDLALLRLDVPLNLPAVQVSNEIPDARNNYFISGYTKTPDVIESRMSLSTKIFPLTSIIEPNSPHFRWLTDNGFPLPSAQIIRLGDPIQHGDSGSPILNAQGQLVGIADGGLRKGVQRMNWGISTRAHMNDLWNSNENTNVNPSTIPFLKNARSENQKFDAGTDMDLYYIFSDYIGSIYDTAAYDDQEFMKAYQGYGIEASNRDIFQLGAHVYEDYSTGATIAIPDGLSFQYDPSLGLLRAWSPSGNVEMNILIKEANSYSDAVGRIGDFQTNLFMGASWRERSDGNYVTDVSDDEFYAKSINCTQYDEYGEEKSSLIAEILIDGPYVLATSVTVKSVDYANQNPMDWYYTYAMEACLVLAGFPID